MLKLGIISDTHGQVNETVQAIRQFRERQVETVIHCGDIGNANTARVFRRITTHFVLGNSDFDEELIRVTIEETGNHFHGWFGSVELSGKRIAFLHGNDSDKFDQESKSGNWDLLCYGHTHVADLKMHGSTALLNPGAFKQVPSPTVAIVTLPDLTVERFRV